MGKWDPTLIPHTHMIPYTLTAMALGPIRSLKAAVLCTCNAEAAWYCSALCLMARS